MHFRTQEKNALPATAINMLVNPSIVNLQLAILPGHPKNHSWLLREFSGKILDAAVLHAISHAMFHARRFESLSCQVGAQYADFCGEGEIGEICSAVGKLLFHFEYLDASHSGLMTVLLGAGELTAVTSGTVFVID